MIEQADTGRGRIGIIGAGAMGSSLAAIAGRIAPTVMVVRNPGRAATIFEHGIVVEGKLRALSRPIIVGRVADLVDIGGVGVIFIATKTTAIASVCAELKPVLHQLGHEGRPVHLVSYQNGIDPGREIMRLLEWSGVVRMVLNYGATLDEETGITHVHMHEPPHVIGCVEPPLIEMCKWLAARLTEAEFPTEYVADIETPVWLKAILNAAMSPVAALVDSSIGEVRNSPAMPVVRRLLEEAIAVGCAHGISIPAQFTEQAEGIFQRGGEHVPSMVEDIRRGRESEVGQLNRQIVEHARTLGVPVPTHETIDSLIEAFDWRVYHAVRHGGAVVGDAP